MRPLRLLVLAVTTAVCPCLAPGLAGQQPTAPPAAPAATAAAPAVAAPATPALGLIPEPREGRILGTMPLRGGVAILPGTTEDGAAATDLTAALRERGVRVEPDGAVRVHLLRVTSPAAREVLRRARLAFAPEMRDEGYVLLARRGEVDIVGQTATGVFYGAQTLKQLVDGTGASARLRQAEIRDWPAMRWRGWQDDMSRGPVPTMDFLRKQIRTMAAYKVNFFSPYWEQTLAYPDHPLVGPPGGAITPEQARERVAYARQYHITIIPEQEAFGHLHHVLKYELYSSLGETPNGHVLAPADTGALPLIKSMFGHIDSIFPGPYMHIGADETFELGRGRTAADVRTRGLDAVYIDFLRRIADELRPFGKRLLFWGDIAYHSPQLVKTLPHELVAVPWDYDSAASYVNEIKPFTDAGMETWVAPGVNGWNKVYPDFGVALVNIRNFTRDGQQLGAVGQLNTSWDDDGETLFNGTWYALLYGAAAAWQPAPADIADFQQNFGRVFHGDTTGRIDQAQKKLIEAHALLRRQGLHFASDYLFWADPWTGEGIEAARRLRPVAQQLRVLSEEALRLILQAQAANPREPDALAAMALGARRIDLIGQKVMFADQMVGMYGEATRLSLDTLRHGDAEEELSSIGGMNGRMQDMRDSYSLLRDLYQQAWLRENRPYWLTNVLALYDGATQTWLQRIERMEDARIHWRRTRHLPTAAEVGLPADSAAVTVAAPATPAAPTAPGTAVK